MIFDDDMRMVSDNEKKLIKFVHDFGRVVKEVQLGDKSKFEIVGNPLALLERGDTLAAFHSVEG